MAYIVNKYNGVEIAAVQDGTVDHTTDLTFIGKNYAGYGEVQNENFLHLLENFSNTTQPARPVEGQIWYDSDHKVLKYYNGFRFKAASVEYGSTVPTNPALGDLWWDSAQNKLYTYNETGERSGFHLVGPADTTSYISVQARTVSDNASTPASHNIVQILANNKVVAIFNSDAAFDIPYETDPIDVGDPEAFKSIKQGITLRNTAVDGVSSGNWKFWGSASNSNKLAGYTYDAFARLSNPNAFTAAVTVTPSLTVNHLTISETSNDAILTNTTGNMKCVVGSTTSLIISSTDLTPGITDTISFGTSFKKWKDIYASGDITASSLVGDVKDGSNNVILNHTDKTFKGKILDTAGSVILDNTITSPSTRPYFKGDIYGSGNVTKAYDYATNTFTGTFTGNVTSANALSKNSQESDGTADGPYKPALESKNFTVVVRDSTGKIKVNGIDGNASGADTLKVTNSNSQGEVGNYRAATINGLGNTVAARDSAGNINAAEFRGVATQAYYADLAEKYLADADYEVGTVVVIGGEKEVTACTVGGFAIGVVSENPAYMMNSALENGTYIALKGRVPVKVVGTVNKGDRLIAAADGCATANNSTNNRCFGVALESNSDIAAKLVEVLVL